MKTPRLLPYVLAFAAATLLVTGWSLANEGPNHQTVNGLDIYIGLMPVEAIKSHGSSKEMKMHGGVPRGSHRFHLVTAVFDNKSGQRIEDARIKASLSEFGLARKAKWLERMSVNGAITYGNYFVLPRNTRYQLHLNIEVADRGTTQALFEPVINQ